MRNVVWFNSPSKNVMTKDGKSFLDLMDNYFPAKHRLNKVFNRNTLKVCYSCMSHLKSIVNSHNHEIFEEVADLNKKSCSCINIQKCSLSNFT